jgi:hypothetical protein
MLLDFGQCSTAMHVMGIFEVECKAKDVEYARNLIVDRNCASTIQTEKLTLALNSQK